MAITDYLKTSLASTAADIGGFETPINEVFKVQEPVVRTSENMKVQAYFWDIGSASVASRGTAYNGTASNGPSNTVAEISLTSAAYSDFDLGRSPDSVLSTDSIMVGAYSIRSAMETEIWKAVCDGVTTTSATSAVFADLKTVNRILNAKRGASKLASNWTLVLTPEYKSMLEGLFIESSNFAALYAPNYGFSFKVVENAYLPSGVNGLFTHKGAAVVATAYQPNDEFTMTEITSGGIPFTATEYTAGARKVKINLASEFGYAVNSAVNTSGLALKLI